MPDEVGPVRATEHGRRRAVSIGLSVEGARLPQEDEELVEALVDEELGKIYAGTLGDAAHLLQQIRGLRARRGHVGRRRGELLDHGARIVHTDLLAQPGPELPQRTMDRVAQGLAVLHATPARGRGVEDYVVDAGTILDRRRVQRATVSGESESQGDESGGIHECY